MQFPDRAVVLHRALIALNIPHAIGGALALAYHAEPRGTYEIDLNVFLRPGEAGQVIAMLSELGVEPPGDDLSSRPPAAGIRCNWGDTHLDLFFSYDDEFFNSVEEHVAIHAFFDSDGVAHDLPFISAEDLAIFKIGFNRPKDWVDIEAMFDQQPLDLEYVERWLIHLRGQSVWPRVHRFRSLAEQPRRDGSIEAPDW